MSPINSNHRHANIKTENTVLFHAIQMHLSDEELDDLNATLLQFVEICAHYRPNFKLTKAILSIKAEFDDSI